MSVTCTSGVWKQDGSQWKVDTNIPKFAEGCIGMYHWEIYFIWIWSKQPQQQKWRSNHYKLTRWCVYHMHIWCVKTRWQSMKSWYKQSQTCWRVHRNVSLRNIMFGYSQNSHNNKNEDQTTVNYPDVSIVHYMHIWFIKTRW